MDIGKQDVWVLNGRYRVLYGLGSGGGSVVYAAHDTKLDRNVAIKLLRPGMVRDAGAVDGTRREGAVLGAIASRHVVAAHDLGEDPVHGPSIVMQRVFGQTLQQEIERYGAAALPRVGRLGHDILAGVAALHESGYVHRDLTPSNVMFDRDDVGIVLDVGAAAERRRGGLPAFDDPDPRSDLAHVGLLLAYLATGERVHAAEAERRVALRSVELARVIARALAPRPQRYSSAHEMAEELRAVPLEIHPHPMRRVIARSWSKLRQLGT